MEFHEKLQELRKQKGLTQEELAAFLFVSRTAVSKWESGRGYPNIDSLKAISAFFSVTIDTLLSGDEVLTIAEEEQNQKERRFHDLCFGALDAGSAAFFFLPFFGQVSDGVISAASLFSLTEISPYLKTVYFLVVIGTVLTGILTLALQNCTLIFWVQNKNRLSFFCSIAGVFLFIISQQPYAAAYSFFFLCIKAGIGIKWR